jgi:hypothetical protein
METTSSRDTASGRVKPRPNRIWQRDLTDHSCTLPGASTPIENAPDLTGRGRSLYLEHETGLAGGLRPLALAERSSAANRRPPRWQRGGTARNNAYLQLLLCKQRQGAAHSGICDDSRLYPAPSWDENPGELWGPIGPDPGPLHTHKIPRAGGGNVLARERFPDNAAMRLLQLATLLDQKGQPKGIAHAVT